MAIQCNLSLHICLDNLSSVTFLLAKPVRNQDSQWIQMFSDITEVTVSLNWTKIQDRTRFGYCYHFTIIQRSNVTSHNGNI